MNIPTTLRSLKAKNLLSLAISYGIIQSHSGDIIVEREAPHTGRGINRLARELGKGATIRVRLPINAEFPKIVSG